MLADHLSGVVGAPLLVGRNRDRLHGGFPVFHGRPLFLLDLVSKKGVRLADEAPAGLCNRLFRLVVLDEHGLAAQVECVLP